MASDSRNNLSFTLTSNHVLTVVLPVLCLLRLLSCASKILKLSGPQRLILVHEVQQKISAPEVYLFLLTSCWISTLLPPEINKVWIPALLSISNWSKPCRPVLILILICLDLDMKFRPLFRLDFAIFKFISDLILWFSRRSPDEVFQLCTIHNWDQWTNSQPFKHQDMQHFKTNSFFLWQSAEARLILMGNNSHPGGLVVFPC